MERIDKLLSHALNITRSEARGLLKKGAVRVNGAVVASPAQKADEQRDVIEVNGEKLCFQKFVYIMMNKPQGVISSTDGRKTAEKTVIDILPAEMKRKGLFPAGRLDKNTTGFMLITDDGAFAHDILSPKKHISKTYIAELDKPFPESAVEKSHGESKSAAKFACRPCFLRKMKAARLPALLSGRENIIRLSECLPRSAVRWFRLKEFAWAICRLMKSWLPANANIFRMRKFQKSRICKNCKNRPPWHKILWFLVAFLFALCNLNKKYDKLYIKCLQIV